LREDIDLVREDLEKQDHKIGERTVARSE
jgi:hypothetical protein